MWMMLVGLIFEPAFGHAVFAQVVEPVWDRLKHGKHFTAHNAIAKISSAYAEKCNHKGFSDAARLVSLSS